MSVSYNWNISQTNYNTDDKLIFCAHYTVNAVDGEHTAGSYGTVGFERGESFIPYDSLTEAQVIAWVKDKLDVEAIEANLASQIALQKAPVTATGVPW
jgi:hypothetical protein